jgi:hypothetical protein
MCRGFLFERAELVHVRYWPKADMPTALTMSAFGGIADIERPKRCRHAGLFISERGQPVTRQAVNYIIGEAGGKAKL